jgi:hypothetical protein
MEHFFIPDNMRSNNPFPEQEIVFDRDDNLSSELVTARQAFQPSQVETTFDSGLGELDLSDTTPNPMLERSSESDMPIPDHFSDPSLSVLLSLPDVALHAPVTRPSSFGDIYSAHASQSISHPPHQNNVNSFQPAPISQLHHPQRHCFNCSHYLGYAKHEPFRSYDSCRPIFRQSPPLIKQGPDLNLNFGNTNFRVFQHQFSPAGQDPNLDYGNFNLSRFDTPRQQNLITNHDIVFNAPKEYMHGHPSVLTCDVSDPDMLGRHFSELYDLGESSYRIDSVARVRASGMYQQTMDSHFRTKDGGYQPSHDADPKLTQTRGEEDYAKSRSAPDDNLRHPNLSQQLACKEPQALRHQSSLFAKVTRVPAGNMASSLLFHGAVERKPNRCNMGQDTSQISSSKGKFSRPFSQSSILALCAVACGLWILGHDEPISCSHIGNAGCSGPGAIRILL